MVQNYEFLENAAINFEKRILERARDNLEITLQDLRDLVEIGRILSAIEKKRLETKFNNLKTGSNSVN